MPLQRTRPGAASRSSSERPPLGLAGGDGRRSFTAARQSVGAAAAQPPPVPARFGEHMDLLTALAVANLSC